MNSITLKEASTHKHLGITFSSSCTWSEHINNITDTAWKRLNIIRALKFKISRLALEKLYTAYVRPLLEYSDSVWDNCSNDCKRQLESIHNEAARIVSGATKLCSIEKMLADLGWESLHDRRQKHKLVIFYKIVNSLVPDYLSNLLPPLVQERTTYSLRNANDIRSIHAHTNLFFNSFLPSTIRAWNDLPDNVKEASTVSSFKYRLNRDLRAPPKYFNAGSRIGQILQGRLRMECSSLNSDLFRKNIVPSPSCSCGGFESAFHFFYTCPKYADVRNRHLSDLLPTHNVHDLLFGKENAPDNDNELLFLKVQDFIIKSKRFVQ